MPEHDESETVTLTITILTKGNKEEETVITMRHKHARYLCRELVDIYLTA